MVMGSGELEEIIRAGYDNINKINKIND